MLRIVAVGTPETIGYRAQQLIRKADNLYVQTLDHPCTAWIKEARQDAASMDDLFIECEDFDQLNQKIAQRLLQTNTEAVYAVPGAGIEGTEQLREILRQAQGKGIAVERIPGVGYAAAVLSLLDQSQEGCSTVRAQELVNLQVDVKRPMAVEELDCGLTAGEVKLKLMDYYPEDWQVSLFRMDKQGCYHKQDLPLYELDRQKGLHASTVLYLPATELTQLSRHGLAQLEELVVRLRAPGGCPWDAEQTHQSLKESLLEETYEVLDALDREDEDAFCEELGDLLLQVVFHGVIAQEHQSFSMRDITTGIVNKLIYRHPHVFGSARVNNAQEVLTNWEQLKKKEKHQQTQAEAMQAVPHNFPALMRSYKVQKKAAAVGFDWTNPEDALEKVTEESRELLEAMQENTNIAEELGDLLFAAVNVVRLCGQKPEQVLQAATDKFIRRFTALEALASQRKLKLEEMTLDQMDSLWDEIKK